MFLLVFYFFYFSFGNILSNPNFIFLANINSAGDNLEFVPGFGVTRYTGKKIFVWPLVRGRYGVVVRYKKN